MKIAYLIQAHKNAEQLNELIGALSCEDADFFLHVDKKSAMYGRIAGASGVHVLSERIDVRWGTFSQVEATLALMRAVQDSGRRYDYVWLISGQDYPIKPNEEILEFFERNRGKNFVEVLPDTDRSHKKYLKRNETWYPVFGTSPKPIMRVLRELYNTLTGGNRRSFFKRKNTLGAEWKFGSSWFAVTQDCMNAILRIVEERPYAEYFRHAICPDESFFQTILWNSEYRSTLAGCLTYVDWSANRPNPKLLSEEDVPALARSERLLARKFERVPEGVRRLAASRLPSGGAGLVLLPQPQEEVPMRGRRKTERLARRRGLSERRLSSRRRKVI